MRGRLVSVVVWLVGFSASVSLAETYDLAFSTFFGGSAGEGIRDVEVDGRGNCYSSTCAFSSSFPTTPGAVQRMAGGKMDWGVVKLSATGALLAGTLLGGSEGDNPDGIRVDSQGNLIVFGQSGSGDFPVSSGAYQSAKGSMDDAVIVKLSPNLDRVI